MRPPVPTPESFTSRLRSPAVAARVGVWLGISFGVCFVTGLISHYAQATYQPVPFPTSPAWGYRVTQGLHVTTGVAAVPLLLVKLWSVYPKLFELPRVRRASTLLVDGLEKLSIVALVAAGVFMLVTGVVNTTRWYPWSFSFRPAHYAVAWVAVGAIIVHVAVKLPIIRHVLGADVDDTRHDRASATEQGALSRRGLLRSTWLASGVAVLATAGGTVPWLRKVSVLAPRSGEGPQGIPVNRSARSALVTRLDGLVGYTLDVVVDGRTTPFTLEQLHDMEQRTETLPIACVEGWSASGDWTGVRLRDLLDAAGADRGKDLVMVSMQRRFSFRVTELPANFADDDRTLVALGLNGEELELDHGFPCRLIAPDRPGVLQTKWLDRIEVQA